MYIPERYRYTFHDYMNGIRNQTNLREYDSKIKPDFHVTEDVLKEYEHHFRKCYDNDINSTRALMGLMDIMEGRSFNYKVYNNGL